MPPVILGLAPFLGTTVLRVETAAVAAAAILTALRSGLARGSAGESG